MTSHTEALPPLGPHTGMPAHARQPFPPRQPAGKSRTPRGAQAKGGGGPVDADAMFASHLRRMNPGAVAAEMKKLMDETTMVKLQKRQEVEALERALQELEEEVDEAKAIKVKAKLYRIDQENLMEEKELEMRQAQSQIRSLERDRLELQQGLQETAALSEQERLLLTREREAFETTIGKTLTDTSTEKDELSAQVQALEAALNKAQDVNKRVIASAKTAKIGLLKQLKVAKSLIEQNEKARQVRLACFARAGRVCPACTITRARVRYRGSSLSLLAWLFLDQTQLAVPVCALSQDPLLCATDRNRESGGTWARGGGALPEFDNAG